jgi:hypothetical protein
MRKVLGVKAMVSLSVIQLVDLLEINPGGLTVQSMFFGIVYNPF